MFSDELLEQILLDPEIHKVPIGTQSTVIHVCERILEKNDYQFLQTKQERADATQY